MVSVDVKNKYLRRLDPDQQKKASYCQAMRPAEKLGYICHVRRKFVQDLCIPLLIECGIVVGMDPKTVDGRLLAPPVVEYMKRDPNGSPLGYTRVCPRDGGWNMNFARRAFEQEFVYGGKRIDSVAVILASRSDGQKTTAFLNNLLEKATALGERSSLRGLVLVVASPDSDDQGCLQVYTVPATFGSFSSTPYTSSRTARRLRVP